MPCPPGRERRRTGPIDEGKKPNPFPLAAMELVGTFTHASNHMR